MEQLRKMAQARLQVRRRSILAALVSSVMLAALLVGVVRSPASAATNPVTSVSGSAFGHRFHGGLFGGPRVVKGYGQPPTEPASASSPSVSLPAGGSSSPVTASKPLGAQVVMGPARIFGDMYDLGPSGPLSVSTQGTAGGGSVTSSAHVVLDAGVPGSEQDPTNPDADGPGGFGPGPLIGEEAHSTCTADASGVRGSSTFVNALIETKVDTFTQAGIPSFYAPIPANPPPNWTVSGTIDHVGDSFTIVINEQVVGPDSITVNAAHMYFLGGNLRGDMVLGSSTCSLTSSVANGAPVVNDDTFTIPEDTPLTLSGPGLLANDGDPDANPLTATNAQAVFVPGPDEPGSSAGTTYTFPSVPANGTATINGDGSLTYTPKANFFGTDTIKYVGRDARGAWDDATVTINVTSVPDVPVAADDFDQAFVDTPLVVPAPGLLANDTDGDGDTLTAGSASDPPNGTVSLSPDGSFTYTPDGVLGTDTFTYVVSDGTGRTDTATVTIPVTAHGAKRVKDITPGAGGSSPSRFTSFGDSAYFLTSGPTAGLWKTDGTAAGTVLVKAFTSTGTAPLTVMGDAMYFAAPEGATGSEVWKSDGTAAGTVLVKDINPGTGSSSPANFTVVGSSLFFSATSGTSVGQHGTELWKTDGTAAGTVLVKDINPGTANSSPANFASLDTTLFFSANDGTNGIELWKSDGTAAGTVMVKHINTDSGWPNAFPSDLTPVGNTVFFSARTGRDDAELWKTDGTEAGTVLVKNIYPDEIEPWGSFPTNLTAFGNTLLFAANDLNGTELWRSDGTDAGTVMVADLQPTHDSNPSEFRVFGNMVLFSADDYTGVRASLANSKELWRTDGTKEGTVLVKDINPGPKPGSDPSQLTVVGDAVYFSAATDARGRELWKTDGTFAGTVQVDDINPGSAGSDPSSLTAAFGTLLFSAADAASGAELWRLADPTEGVEAVDDGYATRENTVLTVPAPGVLRNDIQADRNQLTAGSASDPARGSVVLNRDGSFTYTPDPQFSGTDMFTYVVSDGTGRSDTGQVTIRVTPTTVTLVKDINPGDSPSSPGSFAAAGDTVVFAAADPTAGTELWKTDGTAEGTALLKDMRPGPDSSHPVGLTEFGGAVYFSADDGTNGNELWKSDGTAGGTVMVKDINPGANSSSPSNLKVVGSLLYFSADDGTNGTELWKSDGTAAGTVLVKDIILGAASGAPASFASIGTTLFFSAGPAADVGGQTLWKSDGTAEGTVLVKDPALGPSKVRNLRTVGNVVFFGGWHQMSGNELWKSDGTDAGTVLVKDINPGTGDSWPEELTAVGTTLIFTALSPFSMWKSDGTADGTVQVKEIFGFHFTAFGSMVLFNSDNELWRSDGTEAGTVMVKDIKPGQDQVSIPRALTVVGNVVYFSADDGTNGRELWKTDGSADGTLLVKDIRPGAESSNPSSYTAGLGTMFFNADDGVHGAELWRLAPPNRPPSAAADTYSTNEDTPLTVGAPGVLANDSDADGDPLTAGSPSAPGNGTIALAVDGSFTYTPDADFNGTDSFTYTVTDGNGGSTATTVTVTVAPANDAPVAADDNYTATEDTPLSLPAPGVLGNDADVDGDTLSAGSASAPTNGTVTVKDDGSFIYAPDPGFVGTDTFTYKASDGTGESDTATVLVDVVGLNDAPLAVDDAYTTAAATPLTVSGPGVLANDTDPDGDPLSSGWPSDPANGSVTLNVNGSFTYTPDGGFVGTDTFTYAASDPYGAEDAATVTITVSPPPPPGDTRPTQLAVSDLSVAEGDGARTATFTVTRAGNTTGLSTVKYKTSGGTATAGVDYTPVTTLGTLAFGAGEATKTVNVAVAGDTLPEANETFNLVLSAPTGAVVADGSGTATIRNDDGAAWLSVDNVTVTEGNSGTTLATFTVTRSGNTTGVSSVKYRTNTGTAGADDFTAVALTTVSFAAGETTKTVTVNVTGDTADESNETFTLALSAAVGATIVDTAGTATIVDDEGTIVPGPATFVSVDNVLVNEGNSGTTPAVFTVTRTGNTGVASTVKYKTSGGTATAGGDYTAIATLGTLSFTAGETTKTVTVDVAGDSLPEADDTFNLVLSAPTGAAIADASGTATIVNDDGAAYLAVDNVAVTEGNSGTTQVTFTVTRSGNTTGASSVKVKTSGGTATAGTDYTAVPLTAVDFAAGETTKTVTVDITGDTVKEAIETVNLALSTPVGATVSDAAGTATILNDDT